MNLRSRSTENIRPRVVGIGGSVIVTFFSAVGGSIFSTKDVGGSGQGTDVGKGHGTRASRTWVVSLCGGSTCFGRRTEDVCKGIDNGFGTAPDVGTNRSCLTARLEVVF